MAAMHPRFPRNPSKVGFETRGLLGGKNRNDVHRRLIQAAFRDINGAPFDARLITCNPKNTLVIRRSGENERLRPQIVHIEVIRAFQGPWNGIL